MLSSNTVHSARSKILAEAIDQGCYSLPKILDDLPLNRAAFDVLRALFYEQDDFLIQSIRKKYDGWFFVTNSNLAKKARISRSTMRLARFQLKQMGIIDYRVGRWKEGKATEYRILIDQFYLADRLMGSKVTFTKTKTSNYGKS